MSEREADLVEEQKGPTYSSKKGVKYRTTTVQWKSSFERNEATGKLQLSKGIALATIEMIRGNKTDMYDFKYIYDATPISNATKVKNNINLKEDMFKLNGKYDPAYWKNHEVLTLTREMQEFVNRVNSMGKNSDFNTRTNMK